MTRKPLVVFTALLLVFSMVLPLGVQAEPIISNVITIDPVTNDTEEDEELEISEPLLSLTTHFSPGATIPGGTSVLNVILANDGNADALDNKILVYLPEGLTPVSPETLAYDEAGRYISWNVDVPAGAKTTIAVDLMVSEDAVDGDTFRISASCGDLGDTASLVVEERDLQLSMRSSIKRGESGDPVQYKITLKNVGETDAVDVCLTCDTGAMDVQESTISDDGVYLDGQIRWMLYVPADDQITVEYTANIPVFAWPGDVYVACAAADELEAAASVTVVDPEPILTIAKKVNNRTPAPDTTVKYTITVTNSGDGDAYDVKVIDDLPEELKIDEDTISGEGEYSLENDTIVWYVDVPARKKVKLTFRAHVPDWAEDGDEYVNRVSIPETDSARVKLIVTEGAVPKTGYGDIVVVPAAWSSASDNQSASKTNTQTAAGQSGDPEDMPLPAIQEAFLELHAKNNDLAGWLNVPDVCDMPILQGENNDFYMIHDFDKKDSEAGALFLDEHNSLFPADQNLLIYGHNMKSGDMFGNLQKYRDLDFLKSHPTFTFQSVYDEKPTQYAVVTVVDASMDAGNADYLKIRVPNFDDEQAMLDYIADIQSRSYFSIPLEVGSEDHLLTLVTCSYFQDNGRLLVTARALREGETPEQLAERYAQSVKM